MDIRDRWMRLCERLGAQPESGESLYRRLESLYAVPPRRYHTLGHVEACLQVFDGFRTLSLDADLVEFAIFLHDCVYDPRRNDNERRSAETGEAMLAEIGAARFSQLVRELILATRHEGAGATRDERLLMDVDLSVLGADVATYEQYAQAIRAEYGFASDEQFAAGRGAFIRMMLARPTIYQTAELRAGLEARARANLAREALKY